MTKETRTRIERLATDAEFVRRIVRNPDAVSVDDTIVLCSALEDMAAAARMLRDAFVRVEEERG